MLTIRPLATVAVIAWALFAALKFGFIQTMRARSIDVIRTAAKESTSFIESILGIGAIKAFGQEGDRLRMAAAEGGRRQCPGQARANDVRLDAAGQFIIAIEPVLFVYLAIKMAFGRHLHRGMIFAFIAYKQHFLDAATGLFEPSYGQALVDGVPLKDFGLDIGDMGSALSGRQKQGCC